MNSVKYKESELEKAAKKRLMAYLSAYFLIERFNDLEKQNFNKIDIFNTSYSDFISEVNKQVNRL